MAPRKKTKELTGFAVGKHAQRTKKLTCDLPGFEGFEVELKRLTFTEIDDLPRGDASHREAWESIYPFVLKWNAQGMTEEGSWEDVPPPAEAGADAFLMIEPELSAWIWSKLKYGHLGGPELLKNPTPSESGPETDGDSNSG